MGKVKGMDTQEQKRKEIEKLTATTETTIGQVYMILENYPESRGNDGILLCHWMKMFKGVDSFQAVFALAKKNELAFETVRRARQRIQHAGKFLPDENIVCKRRNLQESWRSVQSGEIKLGEGFI